MASFFAKSMALPPSQMLARNASGGNSWSLVETFREAAEWRVFRVWWVILSEPLARGGDIDTSPVRRIITPPRSPSKSLYSSSRLLTLDRVSTIILNGNSHTPHLQHPPLFPRLRLGHHDRRNFLLLHQVVVGRHVGRHNRLP